MWQCWYCTISERSEAKSMRCYFLHELTQEVYILVMFFFCHLPLQDTRKRKRERDRLMWNSDGVSTNRGTLEARPLFKRVKRDIFRCPVPKFSNTTEGTNQLKTQKYEEDAINYGHAKFSVKKTCTGTNLMPQNLDGLNNSDAANRNSSATRYYDLANDHGAAKRSQTK